MEPFDTRNKQSVYFIVKNISSINRVIKIFNTKIGPGQQLDLMMIPGISEEDIRTSLLKGQLKQLLNNKTITVVNSTISLNSPDATFTQFLNTNNVYSGLIGNAGALTQADWYVDWINGNDNNDGKTAATAVKTVMGGVVAKWGTISPVLNQTTTLHILSSQPVGAEAIILRPVIGVNGVNFNIIGAYTQVGSTFTLGIVTAKNRSTPQLLTVASMPAGATGGLIVHNTTHASRAMIASMSGSTATMCQPFALNPLALGYLNPTEVDTWVTGDSAILEQPTTLNLLMFEVISLGLTSSFTGGSFSVQGIHIPDPISAGSSTFYVDSKSGAFYLVDCSIDTGVEFGGDSATVYNLNVWMNPNAFTSFLGLSSLIGGVYASIAAYGGQTTLDGDVILNGGYDGNEFADSVVALAYVASGQSIKLQSGCLLLKPYWFATGVLWGPGSVNVQYGGALVKIGSTFTATLLVTGGIDLDSAATGSQYNAGVWTSGVATSAANLDAHGGLMNPVTGSRIAAGA